MKEACECLLNEVRSTYQILRREELNALLSDDILSFHQSIENYSPTPLFSLPNLSMKLRIKELWIKDESKRFGLKAFKGLGASYAIFKFLQSNKGSFTFCTATDGNHGRAVAWAARLFNQKAVIFVPRNTVKARIKSIEREGAEVIVTEGNYDQAVETTEDEARKHGWQAIQDTSWPGYTQIPTLIMAGYLTMFKEMESTLHPPKRPDLDFVFLQVGVGSWASSAVWYYRQRYKESRPKIVCVEPTGANCLLESMRCGKPGSLKKEPNTIMAGLSCGTPSLVAWPILRNGVDLFLSITDDYAEKAMRTFYFPEGDDAQVIAGESGAAGLGGLLALLSDPHLKRAKKELSINERSRILVYSTEGDTDPVSFGKIIAASSRKEDGFWV